MNLNISLKTVICLSFFASHAGAQGLVKGDDYLDLGPVKVRPFVEGRVGYDSNVLLEEGSAEEGDTFVAVRAGLSALLDVDPIIVGGTFSYFWEEFSDVNEADDDDIEATVHLGIGSDASFGDRNKVQISASGKYNKTDELDRETGRLEDRENIGVKVGAGRTFQGILGDVDLGYQYEETNFDSSVLFDRDEHTFSASTAPKLTDKTWAVLYGEYGLQSSNGAADEDFYEVRVGLRSQRTVKTMLSAEVGWIEHSTGVSTVGFDLKATWEATEKTTVALSSGNRILQSSIDAGNQNIQTEFSFDVNFRVSEAVLIRTDITFTQNDLENPLLAGTSGDSDTWSASSSILYGSPGGFYNLIAEVIYSTRNSDVVDNDYDQYIATVGAIVFF